jgi:hypothetical protein
MERTRMAPWHIWAGLYFSHYYIFEYGFIYTILMWSKFAIIFETVEGRTDIALSCCNFVYKFACGCLVSPPFFWKKQQKVKSRDLIAAIMVTNPFLHICVLYWEEEAKDMCVLASKGICNVYQFRMVIVISSALRRTKSWRFFCYDEFIVLVFS